MFSVATAILLILTDPAVAEVPASWAADSAPARIHQALSVRHPVPSCASVSALSENPIDDLRRVAEADHAPPWAPMRAASCVIAEGEAARETLAAWITDPHRQGLSELVLRRLHHLPEPLALDLAREALDASHPEARQWLSTSPMNAIQRLVTP